jgi:hypothetical protein
MWRKNQAGIREFSGGREAWFAAVVAALKCKSFTLDVDEEVIADDERSCYNCRYRRWTMASFTCHAPRSSSGWHHAD